MVVKEANEVAKKLVGGVVEVIATYLWLILVVIALVLIVFFSGRALELIQAAAELLYNLAGAVI
jgi:hypothetical protein